MLCGYLNNKGRRATKEVLEEMSIDCDHTSDCAAWTVEEEVMSIDCENNIIQEFLRAEEEVQSALND